MNKSNICGITLGISLVAGCGDPGTSRLSPAQKVMAYPSNPEYKDVYLDKPSNNWLGNVVAGTHLTVVRDDDECEAHMAKFRKVLVHVDDGERRGVSGLATRQDLRPE